MAKMRDVSSVDMMRTALTVKREREPGILSGCVFLLVSPIGVVWWFVDCGVEIDRLVFWSCRIVAASAL